MNGAVVRVLDFKNRIFKRQLGQICRELLRIHLKDANTLLDPRRDFLRNTMFDIQLHSGNLNQSQKWLTNSQKTVY